MKRGPLTRSPGGAASPAVSIRLIRRLTWILAVVLTVSPTTETTGTLKREGSPSRSSPQTDSHGVYSKWDGVWEGTFRIIRQDGSAEILNVRHIYRSQSPTRQTVDIRDEYPDGRREQKRAENLVVEGELLCRVYRPDGSLEVEHSGRMVGEDLVWSSLDDEGRIRQRFRERVEGDLYSIDGVGIYGAKREIVELYVGRYRRVEKPMETKEKQ